MLESAQDATQPLSKLMEALALLKRQTATLLTLLTTSFATFVHQELTTTTELEFVLHALTSMVFVHPAPTLGCALPAQVESLNTTV